MATASLDNSLSPYLQQVLNKISINEETAAENVRIMRETVDSMIAAMRREDPLFNHFFQRPVYTGSYFEGVRITEPNEFDLALVLDLPFTQENIEIQPSNYPAFFKYHLKYPIPTLFPGNFINRQLERYFDSTRCLHRGSMQSWIESVVAKASYIPNFRPPSSVREVKFRKSGPAFTLLITKHNGQTIDIDLMPCINGPSVNWPRGIENSPRIARLTPAQRTWYLIPKTYKDCNGQVAQSDPVLWRIAMPEAEKALIYDIGCVKALIKLLKSLRDEQNWKSIASYYMKTLVSLAVDEHPSPEYWHQRNMGKLFKEMLIRLKSAMESRYLPYYFYRNDNLLAKMSYSEASNIAGRINTILRAIEINPANILTYFNI